ncbi:MAG TPA: LD-carboxypeptidase [Acetobacteraceae bacterium]|nr:LD-carboxypeptidase [Acetobacteraceae bacterium]
MILHPGDEVALILPAAQLPDAEAGLLEEAAGLLESWGLRATMRAERANHFYLAGTDAARAAHLQAALADPAIRAIFGARGGYGSMRLLPYLESGLDPVEKFLVGFSDITALHLVAAKLWPRVRALHGPNIASRHFLGDRPETERNRVALRQALFDPDYRVKAPVIFLHEGRASGPLIGGCLSLIAAMLGSGFVPDTKEYILFLEDVREAPYRIDRMLVQLRNAGVFSGVAGVVFGEMQECNDDINDLREIIRDVLAEFSFPIAFGLPAGHGPTNIALPLGSRAVLDSTKGCFLLA